MQDFLKNKWSALLAIFLACFLTACPTNDDSNSSPTPSPSPTNITTLSSTDGSTSSTTNETGAFSLPQLILIARQSLIGKVTMPQNAPGTASLQGNLLSVTFYKSLNIGPNTPYYAIVTFDITTGSIVQTQIGV